MASSFVSLKQYLLLVSIVLFFSGSVIAISYLHSILLVW